MKQGYSPNLQHYIKNKNTLWGKKKESKAKLTIFYQIIVIAINNNDITKGKS